MNGNTLHMENETHIIDKHNKGKATRKSLPRKSHPWNS